MTSSSAHVAITDSAYAELIKIIMDGALAPGSPPRIVSLATRLGMSPTPVREALQLLAGEGLVERIPMRGFTVSAPLSLRELAALMHARLVLEPEIASLAAECGSSDSIEKLAANVAATAEAPVGRTYEEYREYLELSMEFHSLVAASAGNRFLTSAVDSIPVHLQRFRLFGEDGVTDFDVSLSEHRAIYDAIAAADPAEARAAMTAHIRAVEQRTSVGCCRRA
jgi:DNA-binding GntR family transcriptional regulator